MNWKKHWNELSQNTFKLLKPNEDLLLLLEAENTDFVRFNQTKVRQTTSVEQAYLTLEFFWNQRSLKQVVTLSGDETDLSKMQLALDRARGETQTLPPNPLAIISPATDKSENQFSGTIPNVETVARSIGELFSGCDLAGLYAGGIQINAVATSKGANHWFSTESLNFNYSLLTLDAEGHNRAVKSQWAGNTWDSIALQSNAKIAIQQLRALEKSPVTLQPGQYRVFMAPDAFNDFVGMLNWNGLSYRAYKLGGCALAKLVDEKKDLNQKFSLRVNYELGLTPEFNSTGAKAPHQTVHFENGKFKNWVASDKTAKEFDVPTSGAESSPWGHEYMRSYEVLPGKLPIADAFTALGTGLYLSHLHYLNWSDVNEARITGMTRYAAIWVENGKPVGPIKDMRFDVSLFKALGHDLEDLTQESDLIPSNDSYEKRSLECSKMPGALFKEFKFTL